MYRKVVVMWEVFRCNLKHLLFLNVLDLVGGPRLQTKMLCSGLGGFWSVQLLACHALRNGATEAWGDIFALHGTAGPRRLQAVVLLCRARILQAGRWGVAHAWVDDGELEVSRLPKAALAFYPACLYSVFSPCPEVCDEDPSVGK